MCTQSDELCPWQEMNMTPQQIFQRSQMFQTTNFGKDEKNKTISMKTSYSKLTKQNATTTCSEFPVRGLRSRVKSMDQPQRQILKATPVKQFCEFRLSKEMLMYRNTVEFPRQQIPRNFMSILKKKQNPRKPTQPTQEINPQLLQMQQQVKKMEEVLQQSKKQSWEIGARRLSNPKYQTFLSTYY